MLWFSTSLAHPATAEDPNPAGHEQLTCVNITKIKLPFMLQWEHLWFTWAYCTEGVSETAKSEKICNSGGGQLSVDISAIQHTTALFFFF